MATDQPRTDDVPTGFDERTILVTMLDYARDTVHAKCEGLNDEQARVAPLLTSPLTTIGGVVNHLRWVEHWWFFVMFLDAPEEAPWTDEDPDAEFRLGAELPLPLLLEDYRAQCDRCRTMVAEHDLDEWAARPISDGRRVTLRWIVHHLVEETARHNGHLDILREMIDGSRGT